MNFLLLFVSILTLNGQTVEFVAYGDWGDPTQDLKDTIASIKRVSPNRSFNLLLGDNFYPAGVSSVNDPQFAMFADIVLGDTKLIHYMLLGNHDYLGSVSAQIQFLQFNSYCDLPSRYYRRIRVENGITVCLIMIDTVSWDSVQVAWIESQLKTLECDTSKSWTVISGHFPIWSAGNYADSANLKSDLLPLMHEYGVQLYLSGHEHLHQIFFDGSVVQVTSGAVGETRGPIQFLPHPLQIWGVSGFDVVGFLRIRLSVDAITVDIVSARNDADFQSFGLTRRGTKKSMFGHINWSYSNSNADHIATGVPTSATSTKSSSSANALYIILMTSIVWLGISPHNL